MEKLDRKNIEDVLALTPMQEGMLFQYLKDPTSDYYFEQLSLEISGKIDKKPFEKAWDFVIETNEMLRTVFRWEKVENPIQIILKKHQLKLRYHDLPGEKDNEKKKQVEKIKVLDKREKFDLQEVPFRVNLCRLEKSKYVMIISNHHILYDGWSNGIILKEFFKTYDDLANEKKLVKTVKTKFKDFVKWNQDQDSEKQEKFWKEYLNGFDTQTGLSVKRRREITTPGTDTFRIGFSRDLKDKIEDFVKKHKITWASFLYSAWGILLQQYNSNNDILFNTTVSGRNANIKGIEEAVGLFINTLPLRVQTYPNEKILDFLSRTNEMVQQWKTFENSSPLNIKEYLGEDYGENLFNSVLVIENYPLNKALMQDITTSILKVDGFSISERTYHDLTVIITTFDDMMIDITYNAALFTERMVKTLAHHFTLILRKMVEHPGENVSVLEISPGEIRECIINKYAVSPRQSQAEYPAPRHPLEKELLDIWSRVFQVGKKEIGIDTNFLNLGVHSLKAAALRSMIHKQLKVKMPFEQLFKCLTIREQAAFIRELKETRYIPVQPVEKREYYVLSPAQNRIFILQYMEESIIHYNGVEVFILEGNVEPERVENTFKKLIERHESLRTSFELRNETPVQRVHQRVEFKIDHGESEEEGLPAIIQDFIKPFRLDRAPLCRVKLLKVGKKRFVLMVDMHHIISDGISIQVLLEDFQRIYENRDLPGALIQYKDYADWLNSDNQKENLKTQERYWLNTFPGEILPLNLYTDYSRPPVQDYKGGSIAFNFDSEATQKLSEFAVKTGTTIYMVLFSAFKVLLWKLTGQEDIVIGTPTAGRSHPDLEKIVGMFVNTLAIRSFPKPGKTFMQFAAEVKDNFFKAYENQDYPFEMLVEKLGLQGERARNPLFDVWINSPRPIERTGSKTVIKDIKWTPYQINHPFTKFDISLYIFEGEDNIKVRWQYKINLFKRSTIQYLLEEYVRLASEIIRHPHKKLRDYSLLRRQRIPVKRNVIIPQIAYTRFEKEEINQSIAGRFEKQAAKYSHNAAVISADGDRSLSYSALNKYANKVARIITEYFTDDLQGENDDSSPGNTTADKPTIALLFGHEIDMPAGIVGALKSGIIYTPLDPTYPENRLIYLLEDSGARLILTNSQHISLARRLQDKTGRLVKVIEINTIDDRVSDENPGVLVNPDQIAYILYTSGSTGNPKGVVQNHRNVLHFIRVFTNNCHINSDDRVFLFANYCFDASIIEMFSALLNGAALHLYSVKFDDVKEGLTQWLMDREITFIHTTPTFYRHLMGSLKPGEKLSSVRIIMMGGEILYKRDVELYREYFPDHCILVNNFGMTEASTNLEYFIDKTTPLPHNFVPMGYPVDETEVFILTGNNKEAAVFEVGELVIKSNYLAPAYWKQPGKTRQVFPPDPLTNQGRVYRTGDLVRLHPDGNIEYIGRKDFQVKLRGFRIELGEIENQLLAHPGIKKAVVIDRPHSSGKKYLCGYITAEEPLAARELKSFLAVNLPDYLIPTYFVQLEQLPLTPTGKIDKKCLPEPRNPRQNIQVTYIAPKTLTDKMIANTWKGLLHLEKVGMDDNFFELGGTSLDIIRLRSKLRDLFRRDIAAVTILANPTIRFLAKYFNNNEAGKDSPHSPGKVNHPIRDMGNDNKFKETETKQDRSQAAVIGMAGRFPGAENIEAFWDNIINGMESISHFSIQELEEAGIDPGLAKKPGYVKAKGVLKDIEYFDAGFFNYSPREAEIMDPQLRILHECVWEALEDAGYNPETYDGVVGCYTGAASNLYWMKRFFAREGQFSAADRFQVYTLNSTSSYGTRISYKLDLKGPSFPVQTGCSTSLVSIHLACQGLRNRECDIAAAGGVSLSLPPKSGYIYQEGMIYSSDGHCRTFDASAGGTVFGDGVGIVVLKSLEDAAADGDTIHAVVKGSAINNDGNRKLGYTAPSTQGQADVIRKALRAAKVNADDIGYIEAHGTGTPLGDPNEIEALKQAFNTGKKGYCRIASVKTNVGHLDAAAGVAGIIKTVLSLKHHLIPPNLHFKQPNPEIDFDNSPFVVNTMLSKWERQENNQPLRAGVSSFGIGGTNAHVILEEAPEGTRGLAPLSAYQLILLSAKTEAALNRMTENLARHFKNNPGINLADAAYTLQVGRKAFNHRRMLVCADVNEAIESLSDKNPEKVRSHLLDEGEGDRNVVFMFSGQGSQYVDMGLELYQTVTVFREEMDRCFEILESLMDYNIKEIIYPGRGEVSSPAGEPPATCNLHLSPDINQTEIAQPLLFAFEYALSKLLMKWGIKPYAMIGHSIGEYVAACLAGVFSLKDALSLVAARGQLMQETSTGCMLGITLSQEELEPLLHGEKEISLAAVNSPSDCVVSGSFCAIDTFEKQLKEKGIKTSRLHTSHAFHSSMMAPILNQFVKRVKAIPLNKPRIPYISNRTGNWITVEQAMDPRYWAGHIRETVQFAGGLQKLFEKDKAIFIEVGPGRMLTSFTRKFFASDSQQPVTNMVRHPKEMVSDIKYLVEKIGYLWLHGAGIDWAGFYRGEKRRRISLPTYPFERQHYWIQEEPTRSDSQTLLPKSAHHQKKDIEDWFYIPSWKPSVLVSPDGNGSLPPSTWLVFVNENHLCDRVVNNLRKEDQEVMTVRIGTKFNKENDYFYTINPHQRADYDLLLQHLSSIRKIPKKIVHMWNITDNSREQKNIETVNETQHHGFYSLLYLAGALGKQDLAGECQITVITNNMQDVAGEEWQCPEKATVLGPIRVIPQEYSNINCRSIDIVIPEPGSWQEQKLLNTLLMELKTKITGPVIAYRGNHRLLQTFEPIHLDKPRKDTGRLRHKGVYLITGGLGGIGFTMAKYLVKAVQAKLILVGRTPLPARQEWEKILADHDHGQGYEKSRKIQRVRELEALGGEILLGTADVSDLEQMQAVIVRARERFGTIHGVIHAAGLAGGGMIQRLNREMSEPVLAPKVKGTVVLDCLLRDDLLDFFILCSSCRSITGLFGQSDYSAANNFLDAFAHAKVSGDGTFCVSINWGSWAEVGMAHRNEMKLDPDRVPDVSLHDDNRISPSEAVDVFTRILGTDLIQVVVSSRDFLELIRQHKTSGSTQLVKFLERINEPGSPGVTHSRPRLNTTYIAPGNRTERVITDIWKTFLGLDRIGIHDNFFELGATSLDLVQLNGRLKDRLGREIPVEKLFTYPTIGSLAGYLDQGGINRGIGDEEMECTEVIKKCKNRLKRRKQSVKEKEKF